MRKARLSIAIICVGNEWQLDDGFGPAVARYLQASSQLPAGVSVLERAVMGYGSIPDLMSFDCAVVVDALDGTGAAPGTIFSFVPEDVATSAPGSMTSLHDVRFADVLAHARILGAHCLQGHCFGAQIESTGDGTLQRGLSPVVAAAVKPCAQAILSYVQKLLDEADIHL